MTSIQLRSLGFFVGIKSISVQVQTIVSENRYIYPIHQHCHFITSSMNRGGVIFGVPNMYHRSLLQLHDRTESSHTLLSVPAYSRYGTGIVVT